MSDPIGAAVLIVAGALSAVAHPRQLVRAAREARLEREQAEAWVRAAERAKRDRSLTATRPASGDGGRG